MICAMSPLALLKVIFAPPPPLAPPLAVIKAFPAWAPLMNQAVAPVANEAVPPLSVIVVLLTSDVVLKVIAAPSIP